MSVVNKMLRDLDRRLPGGVASDQPRAAGLVHGVAAVPEAANPTTGRARARWVGGVITVLSLAGAGSVVWWAKPGVVPSLERVNPPAAFGGVPVTPAFNVASSAVAAAAVPTVPAQPTFVETTASPKPVAGPPDRQAPAPSFFRMETALKNPPKDRPGAVIAPASLSAPVSVEPVAPAKALPKTVGVTTVATGLVQRQIAATEIVEQAQRLWNGGSREAAMGLLRDAAWLAERDHVGAAPAAGPSVLSTLVRELVRMELAEGRVSQALERLVRLESALAGEADLWALRGNAAQRLGRHHESANAYLAALKLRPDQSRWMLGAAVSLAADGQIKAASSWAQSARERGALTPEVAAYLRQLGVSTTEP